jgi:hypothetical protein
MAGQVVGDHRQGSGRVDLLDRRSAATLTDWSAFSWVDLGKRVLTW